MDNRRGFTLVEITIVLVILGIMAIIATSNLMSWLNHNAAIGFQREFLSRCADARTRAMATNLQQKVLLDLGNGTVRIQQGNAGTASVGWTDVGERIVASRGAGIHEVIASPAPGTVSPPTTFSFIFNPGGQVLTQDNAAVIRPLTEAKVRLTADNPGEQTTLRLYGWTSKARLENGWP
jgi:prepilin-type N-terminal cleavage/methylation domain-containing protein